MGLVKKAAAQQPVADRRDGERDPAGLLAQLRHADPEERRRAALDLAGVAEAVPALLAAARAEPQATVRDAVLTTLVAHDLPEVAQELAGWLGDDDAARRNAAVVTLQAMPHGTAAVLDALLVTGDVRVRTLAVMVLSTLAHPGVPDWLEAVVDADPDENVVAAAVDAAQQIDDALARQLSGAAAARFPDNPYLQFLSTLAAGAR
ncbi:HEAT repeat protein [Kineococcus radiotolerans]|uniref:HEAT repeat protein n=1 Tax=Kineococcus radiotolerans TaxID=131568 RepID=A0A7W4TJC8_KINRA|nr:HEAT repeat domain-containing protein [Kineococcus radiotolerans]MBB2899547.1 HEAT repeat protein [Kineococcus radiotolerans]